VARDLSIADFAVATTFPYRTDAGISLVDTPHVTAWIDRLESRPQWQSAVALLLALAGG
jgi:glutathione S-transferase